MISIGKILTKNLIKKNNLNELNYISIKMVFNLATAALIVSEGNTTAMIDYTQFALSITELVFVCLYTIGIWLAMKQSLLDSNVVLCLLLIPLLCVEVTNMVYSGFIINYYNKKIPITEEFFNFSIGILVVNSLSMCGCFSVKLAQKE